MSKALLNSLKASGIDVRVKGGRLKLRALSGILTPEIIKCIKANKTGLLALLHANQADTYKEDVKTATGGTQPVALLTQGSYKPPLLLPEHLSDGWPYRNRIVLGDCLEKLKNVPDNSIDQIATDPPYGIEFMGKDWDKAVPGVEVWRECHRVLKPGAFAFVMCIPRQDCLARMIINLEAAGFKIDFSSMYWTFANGFPKAHNVSRAVDKKMGREREVVARNPNSREDCDKSNTIYESGTVGKTAYVTEPATPKAKELDGSYAGFQPKPAIEIIIVAMKPLSEKTYTDQTLANGKGTTWLDDCRIPYRSENEKWSYDGGVEWSQEREWNQDYLRSSHKNGRFPANLLVSDDVLQAESNGALAPVKSNQKGFGGVIYGKFKTTGDDGKSFYSDKETSTSYSRYFSLDAWWSKLSERFPENVRKNLPFLIVPKACRKEKEAGLEGFVEKPINGRDPGQDERNVAFQSRPTPRRNTHPTIKSIQLMAYLLTMGSRENDTVLDPFCGTATTCIAAKLLNRRYIGIEINPEYHQIAIQRMNCANLTGKERNNEPMVKVQVPMENNETEKSSKIVKRGKGDFPRIYRPCRISEVYGQDEIKKIVKEGFDKGSLAHSFLFYGASGTGKTTLARIIAMGLLCDKGPTSEPCCECDACNRVSNLFHLGVFDINTADFTGIDNIRKIKEHIYTGSMEKKVFKVFIFDECHRLTQEAQNMLLKLVEDSPGHNYFIFCSTDHKKIIKTLLNRCMQIEFKKISPEEIRRLIQDVSECEGVKCPEEIMESIIQESDGMARNALFELQKAVAVGEK